MAEKSALQLTVADWKDAGHWRWVLNDPHGKYLADHTVSLER
jgi:hypothetical protein